MSAAITERTGLGRINDTLASRKKHKKSHGPRTATEPLTIITNANRTPLTAALSRVEPATQDSKSMPQAIIVLHGNAYYPFDYEQRGLEDYCQDKGLEEVKFHSATSVEQVLEHLQASGKSPLIVVRGSISLMQTSSCLFSAKPYSANILDSLKQYYDSKSVPEKDRARIVFMNDDNLLPEDSSTRKIYPQTLAPIIMRGMDIFSTSTGGYPYIETALANYRASFKS